MDALVIVTLILALFTLFLVIANCWLGYETRRLAKDWRKTSRDQIGVQTWLALQARFDSGEITAARSTLAKQLDPYEAAKHDEILEVLPNVFESIGTVYRLKLINEDLAASSFGFYATRWWEAAKPYVYEERRRKGDDQSLYEDFESFAKVMRKFDPKITDHDLKNFLKDERKYQPSHTISAYRAGS